MIAKTSQHMLKPGVIALTLSLSGLLLQGCAGGAVTSTVYAVSGATATKLHLERQKFREKLQDTIQATRRFFRGPGAHPRNIKSAR